MATFPTNQNDDGDTAREPTVKEIDEIYNFLITAASVEDDAIIPKIERMLLTLDRVSNSIHRREEQEEEEKEKKCEPDRCDAVGLCSLDKCYYESDEDEEDEDSDCVAHPVYNCDGGCGTIMGSDDDCKRICDDCKEEEEDEDEDDDLKCRVCSKSVLGGFYKKDNDEYESWYICSKKCDECEEEEICCKCETDCDVWKCTECDKYFCIECDPNEMANYTYNGAGIHCEPCAIANGFALGALG